MSTKFRSQLSVDNIQDPFISNLWEVLLPELYISHFVPGNDSYAPIVEEITFAPLGFDHSQDIRAITTYYSVPVDKQDAKEANITMYCENDMKAQYYIKAWQEMMFNQQHEFYYEPWQYKRDIIINMYSPAESTPVLQYFLKGCFPLLQNDISLKYSKQPGRLTITQKFNVDRVAIKPYANIGRSEGSLTSVVQSVTGVVSSVQNIARNGVNTVVGAIMNSKNKSSGITPKDADDEFGYY